MPLVIIFKLLHISSCHCGEREEKTWIFDFTCEWTWSSSKHLTTRALQKCTGGLKKPASRRSTWSLHDEATITHVLNWPQCDSFHSLELRLGTQEIDLSLFHAALQKTTFWFTSPHEGGEESMKGGRAGWRMFARPAAGLPNKDRNTCWRCICMRAAYITHFKGKDKPLAATVNIRYICNAPQLFTEPAKEEMRH